MKDKNRKSFIAIVGLGLIVLIAFVMADYDSKSYDWDENYKSEDKDPFGSYLIYSLLEIYFPDSDIEVPKTPLRQWMPNIAESKNYNYVFIGDNAYLDSLDLESLVDFVYDGNTAFLACNNFPVGLIDRFFKSDSLDSTPLFFSDSLVKMNFVDQSLISDEDYYFNYCPDAKCTNYEWYYFEEKTLSNEMNSLGFVNATNINFFKIKHGEGYFYFHTNPLAFTNLHVRKKSGLEYAEKVFSYLVPGKIYWDEHSKIDINYGEEPVSSPLMYILSKPSLRWAWYLTVFFAFIYVAFHARRKQRSIALIAPKVNSSIEFVETIGRLYLQQGDHKKIGTQIMKLFLDYNRIHYRISTQEHEHSVIESISKKSGINLEHVKNIFFLHNKIYNSYPVDGELLIKFYDAVENFYQKSK